MAVYYPIDWEDETDTDSDGLTDVYEKYYFETDPTNPDTDGDGLLDGYEVYSLGTDPKKADSDENGTSDGDEDFDEDGLSNKREYELGTDPNNADTDNDSLSDSEEINTYNTDPLKFDTDGDGISDGDEIALGLNPTNAATDGTPDSERTFVQHVGADSENLAAVNTSENPFEVSIDITAAGVAANNLYSQKSGYSNAIKNDAILGITPEFIYTDGLKVEDVIINFTIDNSAVNNYNNKYTGISDEFVGIKRLNVFKFFEDTNMLLPIETFHDVENNRVYTHVDELGTYCLMDMEIWLENLGITAEDLADNTNAAAFSARSMPVAYSDDTEESEQEEQKYLDVVLVAYPNAGIEDIVQKELIYTSNMIFEHAKIHKMDARIFYVSAFGDSVANTTYVTNITDAKKVIGNIAGISKMSVDENSYVLTKAMRYTDEIVSSFFRDGSERYCFVVDAFCFPMCDSQNPHIKNLNEKDVRVHFAYSRSNENMANYMSLSTDNIAHEIIPGDGRYNFGDFILKRIFGENDKDYVIISATGWNEIHLEAPITPMYEAVAKDIENDEELRKQVIALNKYADTDRDGLLDLEEIYYERNGKAVISWGEDEKVILPTFSDCVELEGSLFYVERGLLRFFEETGKTDYSQFDDIRILPIKSDPTEVDSDDDGINDVCDLRKLKNDIYIYNLKDTNYINVNHSTTYSSISFGGSQSWFSNVTGDKTRDDFTSDEDFNMYGLRKNGCGIIASCDVLLYLAKNNSELVSFASIGTKSVNTKNSILDYNEYYDYVREYYYTYINVDDKYKNIWELKSALNSHMSNKCTAKEYSTRFIVGSSMYNRVEFSWCNDDYKTMLNYIISSLEEDKPPVLLASQKIGIESVNYSGVVMHDTLNKSNANNSFKGLYSLSSNNLHILNSHYVTITGVTIDYQSDDAYIEISSWGDKYYISYKEFFEKTSNGIDNAYIIVFN